MHQPFTGLFLIDVATVAGPNPAFAFLLEASGEDLLLQVANCSGCGPVTCRGQMWKEHLRDGLEV